MATKRNLLFISAYTGLGGGESVQLNLMGALDRDRWALHLVCPREGQLPDAAARQIGVTVHILPYRGITTWFWPALWQRFPISNKLAGLLRRLDIHAVHSDYHSLPFAVAAGRQAGNIPVIWNAMGWWFPIRPWQRQFFRHDVPQIIAITRAVRDRWLGDPPLFAPERIPVLVPGVDPEKFHPGVDGSAVRGKIGIGPDVPLVAMIARFQQVKGHDLFLEMAKRVLAEIPEVRFAAAGENVFNVSKDETYKLSILETTRADPTLDRAVTYLGFWEDARQVIAAADVIVCPSRFESLGMVHLETMAMARPIVSMNNGGPAETVVDGLTGCLVSPEDPAALAERVVALLRDPARRSQMGAAGRQHVLDHFTAQHYAEQFSEVVTQLIEQ